MMKTVVYFGQHPVASNRADKKQGFELKGHYATQSESIGVMPLPTHDCETSLVKLVA